MTYMPEGSITPGNQVKVTLLGEMQTFNATFVKISGTGHRIVQMEDGKIFALQGNDLMHKEES